MSQTCELEVPRRELLECPPCTETFFVRVSQVQIGQVVIVVTRRYLLRKCFVGLAVGQHVHSLTLLPKEEVEIEIVRRSKFSRALHEQRSVESEFRSELQRTARDEWSSEEEINKKVGGGVDFSIFGIGVKASGGYTKREQVAEEHFREVVSKTAGRVSRKYEVAIDTKTEVENQYRSVRRIVNPNPCQPVIYNYYQLAKMYKTELILTDIRFDFIPPRRPQPPVLTDLVNAVSFRAESPYRQNLNLQVVAPPPSWTLSTPASTASPQVGLAPHGAAQFAALQAFSQPAAAQLATPGAVQLAAPVVSIAGLPPAQVPIEPPDVMQLTRDELLDKVRAAREAGQVDINLNEFRRAMSEFANDEINRTGVRATYEYCINTEGLYVETTLSKCAACDEDTLALRRLEVEKAQVELELLKHQLNSGEQENDA